MDDLFCVIMAGGAGTRFWPASTEQKPKQLLTLVGDRSLLQSSVDRAAALVPHERIVIVTNAGLADAVRAQLPELPHENVIGEPTRKDTAAAVALATLWVRKKGGKRVAVFTADHLISPVDAFVDAAKMALTATTAAPAEESGNPRSEIRDPSAIVTFGIVPTYPATGYGYVEVTSVTEARAQPALRFVEKPDVKTATDYLASGRFLWNSGMFVFGVDAMIGALAQHLPRHIELLAPVVDAGLDDVKAFAAAFEQLDKISIDKGVMEKHRTVLCVPARFSWSDVGSFPALADHLPHDSNGNAHRGNVHALDAKDNVVWCEDANEEVAIVGLEGVVVVRAGNRTLVMPRSRAEDVKKLVEGMPKA